MRLRSRLQNELKERLSRCLPEVMETAWDIDAVIVMIEQLKFTSSGGIMDGDWELRTEFSGVIRCELRADNVDRLPVEGLIADLVADPLFLALDVEAPISELSENARCKLLDWRDAMRDTQVVSALRFDVSGWIARRAAPAVRPELLVGLSPEIGGDHGDDYTPVGDL